MRRRRRPSGDHEIVSALARGNMKTITEARGTHVVLEVFFTRHFRCTLSSGRDSPARRRLNPPNTRPSGAVARSSTLEACLAYTQSGALGINASGQHYPNSWDLPGSTSSVAHSINDVGQVVGYSIVECVLHATEWNGAAVIDLGVGQAFGISDVGGRRPLRSQMRADRNCDQDDRPIEPRARQFAGELASPLFTP